MKRRNIFLILVVFFAGLFIMQSCKKEAAVEPTGFLAAMPASPAPVADAIIPFTGTGQTINLTWSGTATNAISWDVAFGKKSSPSVVATNVTTNSYTATVTKGGTYFWQVSTTDANGVNTVSPVWSFEVNSNPNVPNTPIPTVNKLNVSCNPNIQWAASDPEGDDLTYDLYLGTAADPAANQSALVDTSFTVTATLLPNTVYFWKVVAHDPYGGVSTSPVWKFTTGALPIAKFVGNYNADEPAETYSYGVSFTSPSSTTIKTTNYWNSGWTATFTLDFAKLTYTMSSYTFSTGWTGIESGIIIPATGKMVGSYTLWLNGVVQEQGVHTYTHL